MTSASRTMNPVALLLGSVAYLYSTISNVAIFPNNSPVLVDTNYGTLSGLKAISRTGRPYIEFRGIPYAKPPLGDLRFEPPERPENWTGIRDATRFGSRCWQVEFITRRLRGNEDCLFLNVYTHRVIQESELNETSLYPVMVYLHGGFFMSGRSSTYRPKYFMDENVVFVTLNYRLASFGFLNTGDDVVTGNMGLKDQNMALQWVQENIMYFGGDPDRVTLVGESAGAVSTHLHMLSPMSAGLFHSAISQSGTALSPWGIIKNPGKQARQLGRRLQCPTKPTEEMIRCLKSRRARSIAWTHLSFLRDLLKGRFSTFGPSIEAVNGTNTFLAEDPRKLLEKGELANKVPWINGVNSEEGLIYLVGVLRDEKKLARLNENWNSLAPTIFDFEEHEDRANLSAQIREYYLKQNIIAPSTLKRATEMFSDRAFFQDSHEAAVLQSKLAPVYSYVYSYHGDFGLANLLLSMSGSLPEAVDFVVGNALRWISTRILRMEQTNYGVCHTDDLVMFFNLATIPREIVPGSPDYPFSRSLVKLWASFAGRGKPGKFQGVQWEPVEPTTAKNGSYNIRRMNLDDQAEMINEPFLERLNFWKSLGLAYRNINSTVEESNEE